MSVFGRSWVGKSVPKSLQKLARCLLFVFQTTVLAFNHDGHIKQLLRLFGPPEIRRSSHIIRELEDDFGLDLSEYQRAKAEDDPSEMD